MMKRADKDLAFMLQYENVAWYEKGHVKILDRRVYPATVRFEICNSYLEVAKAIRDMVTQSAGPYLAARMGMALAAYECRSLNKEGQKKFLNEASYTISHARPTTVVRMEDITQKCIKVGEDALEKGIKADEAIFEHALEEINNKYIRIGVTASYLVSLFPAHGAILTQCFGETIVGQMLKEIREQGKELKIFCTETRPYFQGSRLTASVAYDQGFDVTVITDNMPAFAMQQNMIDVFTSAADAITCNGHIINKVGTLQIAILCKYFGLPYFVTGAPDKKHKNLDTVDIEYRDEKLVLQAMGTGLAKDGVKGWYPAFDITPPYLCDGVVTNKGIFSPYDLNKYFE